VIDELDDLYEIVGQELKRGEERPGLMARATAEADGNPEKTKSIYIRYRLAELTEAREREPKKRVIDEIELLISKHGAIPEILEQVRKAPGFDALSLEEKLRKYLKFESAEDLCFAANYKYAEERDIDAAVKRYKRVIERFPTTPTAKYAQALIDNMIAGAVPHNEIQVLLAQPLSIDSCKLILTMLGHKVTMQETGKWTVQEPAGSKRFLYSFDELESYTKETATLAFAKPDVKPPESSVLMPQGFIPEILAEVRKCTPGFDALPLGEKVARYLSFELPERLARMHRSCPNPVDKQSASHSEVKPSEQPKADQQWSDSSKRASTSRIPLEPLLKAADSRELSTRWLWFYTYILLPFGILMSFVPTLAALDDLKHTGYQIEITPMIFVPIIFYDIFLCFLIYGLHKRRFWAWVCNWVNLGMVVFFNTAIFDKPFGVYIVTTVLLSLVFFLPNYFYFKRRRTLFNGGNRWEFG